MKTFAAISLGLFCAASHALGSVYCPAGAQSINVGATADQVMQACGQPQSTQKLNAPLQDKVPATQLIYNSLRTGQAFQFNSGLNSIYNTYNLPTNQNAVRFEVMIVNNKVKTMKLDGGETNSLSVCGGVSINVDDPVGKVYSACGGPDVVNNTFIEQTIPSQKAPEIWTYQFSPYQPAVKLTIVDGRLQSID